MPTSDASLIPAVLNAVCARRPKSILDCGIGMGKYGALLREYLDYTHGRFQRDQWVTEIDGVEPFELYVNPNWYQYDYVRREDFAKEFYYKYDVVMAIDSLEHVEYDTAVKWLEQVKRDNKYVLVSTPSPEYYQQQGAVFGNDYEVHRHKWTPDEFKALGGKMLYRGVCQLFEFER